MESDLVRSLTQLEQLAEQASCLRGKKGLLAVQSKELLQEHTEQARHSGEAVAFGVLGSSGFRRVEAHAG